MTIENISVLILSALMGMGGVVPITAWLRAKLGTSGFWSLLIAAVVSVVFGILTAASEGQLNIVGWANIGQVAGVVFLASQIFYRMIDKGRA